MKVHLMHPDRDFDLAQPGPPGEAALVEDLELNTLFAAMSGGDAYLGGVVRKAVPCGLADPVAILYRQAVLRDCLAQEAAVRDLYALAVQTIEAKRKFYWSSFPSANSTLQTAVSMLEMLVGMLGRLRIIADVAASRFRSDGFRTLFATLARELDDAYLADVRDHLKQLKFPRGALVSARLGEGAKGAGYVLRRPNPPAGNLLERLFTPGPPAFSYRLAERDEAGARALAELRDRGLNDAANAVAQAAEHVMNFFGALRLELAFYVGCLNLHARLDILGEPVCFPHPAGTAERWLGAAGLYDACLALRTGGRVVGNALEADGKDLIVVTGANQGGKSTFLRSLGQAQIMMQCGMYVPAESFAANVATAVFTHFRREEDAELRSGKLDEELGRMSGIVDRIGPDALVLFNESFAATNEREGSEIARQVVAALTERQVKVAFVTHQYEFAGGLHARGLPGALFLRAERRPDGARSFRVVAGEPLRTSYGEDLYRQVFQAAGAP